MRRGAGFEVDRTLGYIAGPVVLLIVGTQPVPSVYNYGRSGDC